MGTERGKAELVEPLHETVGWNPMPLSPTPELFSELVALLHSHLPPLW